MSSLTIKLVSLAVRTLAKPIGTKIKQQAREREWFRRFAIGSAQQVHRWDMKMRLGLLHDPEAQQRMHDREQKAAEDKKRKAETPTVRSEVEQKKYEEEQARQVRDGGGAKEEKKDEKRKVRIRPLSDARAIELGANFFSEAFIFLVAVGVIIGERWISNSKESARRDEVAERLEALEQQVGRLEEQHHLPELEALNEKLKKAREERGKTGWYNPVGWFRRADALDKDDDDEGIPGETEGSNPEGKPKVSKPKVVEGTADTAVQGKTAPGDASTGDKDSRVAPGSAAKPPERVDTVNAGTKGR